MAIYLVHPNEPAEVTAYLQREKIPFRAEPKLPFDYLLVHGELRVGIERKEARDLIASIKDGRYKEQLYFMSTLCPLSFLVVVGSVTDALFELQFRREAYVGALTSTSLKRAPDGERGHVSVITLDTMFDFMLFLKCLFKQVEEGDYVRLPKLSVAKSDLAGMKVAMLSAIPGVGEKYAKKLVDEFKTIYGVVNAPLADLAKVLGVKRAKRAYDFFRS